MSQQFDIVGNLLLKVDGAEAGLNKLKNSLSQLKLPANLDSNLKKSFSNLDGLFAKYRTQLKDGFNTKGDVTNFAKTGRQIEAEYDRISAAISKVTGKEINLKVDLAAIQNAEKEIEKLVSLKEKLSQNIKGGLGLNDYLKAMQTSDVGRRGTKVFDASNMLQTSLGRGDITKAKADVEGLIVELNRMSEARKKALEAHTGVAFSQIIADLKTKVTDADQAMTKFGRDIETTSNEMSHIETTQLDNATKALADITSQTDGAQSGFKQLNGSAQEAANSMFSMTKQLSDLQQSTQYFFSLRNMINLFKRGVDDAIQSVKELDKAMTDTAVVTDYKVSDMWNMLPQYTKIANDLGATTQGAYETMTLYFQQGLDQQQAFEVGAETMKMARIAGLEYAETTDMMTAALRGFNMELNEASAKRVNDVYSELAAITASDTEELGTAMQRTASIAHSAGASFEGATAFLAQAIETTREPAENIGTAMKTIIARFQEMKKNPLEISEVEGEEVDFNKIDAALKTIGVDLVDTNGQFRDFDKVMLDISARWDTLSQSQQRYIATVAAGSRQQSRFIAMVSNYDRTMELINAANNSAGASNEQFNKTMDSLEAKLNKLHNAWQAFTMGIANNSMIKLAVDGVTNLLTVTNKLIDTLSLGSGTLKSFLSIFTAFNGLKATGKMANALIGGLGGMIDPQSSFSAGFRGGAINKNSAEAINQPIVQELQSIRSLIAQKINQTDLGKGSIIGPYDEYNRFKRARLNINDLDERNSVKKLTGRLAGLSSKNQNLLMRGSAAHFQAATNSLINSYDGKHSKAIKAGERFLNDQRKSAQITAEEYYTALQDPGLLKQAMVKAGVQQDNPAYAYMNGLDEAANIRAKELQDQAIRQAKYTAAETGRGTKEVFDKITQSLTTDRANSYFKQKALADQGIDFSKAGVNVSKMGKVLDGIGAIGASVSQAGMGIQAFGSILISSANPALQAFGSALTSIGGLIGGLGMGISGISSTFTAISGSKLITNIAGTGTVFGGLMSAAGALTGGLLLLGGVVAALVIGIKKHNEKIREAAEKVSTDYKEKNEKAQTNISNLQSWREDFARLSGGVDENGYNVSLSTEDYDRYLEITRGIAEINPSIVDGYNAQGQAIITNNKALEETLKLEKQHQEEAFRQYTDPSSLRKLLKARDLSKITKTVEKETTESSYGSQIKRTTQVSTGETEFKPQASMRKNAQKIGQMLQEGIKEGWAEDDLLEDFNINIGKLAEGDEKTLQKFDEFGPKIQQRINDSMDTAGDNIKDHTKNSMLDAFSGYSDAADELDELVTPTYEYLLATTSEYASTIPAEFKKYFNEGLKDIASDANIKDPVEAAHNLANGFSALSDKGGDYYNVLREIDDAQTTYAQTLNKDDYDKFAKGAVDRLNAIRDQLGENIDLTQGYGKAISEFIDNEIAKVTKFTQEGTVDLQHALNTMVDQIAEAEGALENFNKIAEGSTYGKAASDMSQIFETATADEHIAGEGDQAFWAGAEAIIGRKNLLENGKATKDSALKQMKEVQEMLKGGQEGWDNFKIKWFDSYDAGLLKDIDGLTTNKETGWIETIDENINPEVYEQIADALNMSKDSLIAMLNLGRQFGEVDFTNIDDVQKALATSESTIKNNGTIFARKGSFEVEMTQAGIDLNKQQGIEEELTGRNVQFIEEDLTKITKDNNQFTQMGIDSMESLVKTFDDTGQFTKDEIAGYAEKYAEINNLDNWQNAFNEAWNQNETDQEYGGIPSSLTSIESILSSIESLLAQRALSEGRLAQATADDAKKWLFGGEGADTEAQKFSLGQGANGAITEAEFNKTSQELTDFIDKGTNYLSNLEEAKQKAIDNEDYAELQKIETERVAYENMIKYAKDYLEKGTEAYNNQNGQNNQEWQYGNVSKSNRPQGLTDENGNTVTVLGTSASFGTQDGGEIEIAYTPVVTLNGKADILEDEAAQNYINALIAQLESEGKEVNLDNILELDASGEIEGFEGWKNIIADVGDTAVITAIQMHALEAGLNVENIDKQYQALGETIKKVGDEADKAGQKGETTTNGNTKSSADVQATTYEVFTAGAEGDITALTEKLQYLKDNYPEVHSELITEFPQYGQLETYSEEIEKLDDKEVQQTVTASIASDGSLDGLSKGLTSLGEQNPNIKVSVDEGTSDAQLKKLDKDAKKLDDTKTLKINVQKTGVSSITVDGHTWTISTNSGATGINNKIAPISLPTFGSAAKGKYGQLGPKGSGGLTLTGELGYEVAWIPSENRSMILGANGPQMINLPGDAVVWDHEQSKKIVKQKAITAGSHYVRGKDATDPRSTIGGGGGYHSSNSSIVEKAANDAKKAVTTAAVKVGKVSVWWENIARKTESIQRKADQAYTKFEKYIKSMQATLKTTGTKGGGNDYINNMSKVLGYNQAQYNKANAQLKNLDKSNKKTTIKYKQGKKEKSSKVKLGNYIKYDSDSDTYVIDQKNINSVAKSKKKGGKVKAKAIKDAAEKQINERLSKRNKAEDAINKAKEALDKFGEQLYETFFAWENELTKIWNLTQKITQAESNISRIKSYEELLEKQIATGITSVDNAFKENALANFELEVQQSIDKIVDRQNLLKEQQNAVSKALSLVDERETLDNINAILQGNLNETEKIGYENYAKQLTERINTQAAAQKYLNVTQNADGTLKVEFDTESFENDKLQGLYTGDTAKALQDYVKELVESSETLNQSYDDLINDIGGMYDSLSDLQQQWVDYANDLWDISDAESKKEAENMKKLSDSITDSLKNLLDEVKRKLDERRRQEDNAKTEKDISQKQQRLAALRADTSGGHQVEIAQLEKEIADAQQDYQRSLEDQLLDKMQQQADLASEQRERQIELQEKIAEEINNAALVDLWMSDPQKYRDQIYEAFKASNDYDKKPLILQKDLDNQFESMMSGLTTNQKKQEILNTSIENLTGALDLLKQSIEDMQKGTSQKTIEQLRELGLTDAQIRKAGFGIQDFIKAGTTDAKNLKAAGFSVADLLGANYKNTDIQEAGYTIGQFKTGTGVAGIEGAKLAKEAGYSDEDIVKTYGTEAAMIGANVSGKVAQKINGTSAPTIQSIINKSKTDNAKQSDLSNVQAGKVDINGSKKGGTIKDSHISANGGRVGANKGSTLYTADWNEEKGEANKKWSTITVDKLTTEILKKYPVDAKQALIYAIQHSKPGTKLNKNMESLVATAKIAGNYYKLNNGIYGSIGSNGKIYYNTKDGVKIWNAATGKLTLDKYNKSNYLQKALKNNTISREYAQVLINKKAYTKKQLQDKGVKKFVTGGLANYTGPAWLDGTPSKPELVLNAKDTKNFLALKDVLARAMNGISNTSNTYGDIMYEININVDKIEKDYDVDRVVDKVKKEIIKGAGYRNVTQVRNFK